ncbi:L-ascorbate oxidase-like, partial [Paramuricea clavata]
RSIKTELSRQKDAVQFKLLKSRLNYNPIISRQKDKTETCSGFFLHWSLFTLRQFPQLLFSVNGGRIGPTIIAKYNQLIVADVYNLINDKENPDNSNVSMHWHGMHQFNTPWMDGVGMITQLPTKPRDAF